MRMYITDFINFIIRPVGSMVVISNREPVIKSSWPTFRIQQDVYWLEWADESVWWLWTNKQLSSYIMVIDFD